MMRRPPPLVAAFRRYLRDVDTVAAQHPPSKVLLGLTRASEWGFSEPLTVASAREALAAGADLIADALAEEADRVVRVIAPDAAAAILQRPELVSGWPHPDPTPALASSVAGRAALALACLTDGPSWTPPHARLPALPPGALWREVSDWILLRLYEAGPPVSDTVAVTTVNQIPSFATRTERWPAAGMALAYLLLRAHRLDTSHAAAAREAFAAVRALVGGDADALPAEFVRSVRDALEAARDDDESDDLAAAALADEGRILACAASLRAEARGIVSRIFDAEPPDTDEEARASAGRADAPILRWDARFAEELEGIGVTGRERAAIVRSNAAERMTADTGPHLAPELAPSTRDLWRLWLPSPTSPPAWLRVLARALWRDRWREPLAFERSKHSAALPLLIRRELASLRHGAEVRRGTMGGFEYVRLDGTIVGRFAAPHLDSDGFERMRAGIAKLRGLTFERVVRGLTRAVFRQAAEGVNPYTRLVYPGGFLAFAEEHGISGRERVDLPALFEAMQGYRRDARDIPPILTYFLTGAAPGRRAELRIDVGEALAPGYVSTLRAEGADRWLLPVLPLPRLDFADRSRWSLLCDLQWEALRYFRANAADYAARGAIDVDFVALAQAIDLDARTAEAARREWSRGPAAWLRSDRAGRLALVDAGADALLKEAATISAAARRGGEVSAARKRGAPSGTSRKSSSKAGNKR